MRCGSSRCSYTESTEVAASGATLAELLLDLDRQFPACASRVIDELDRLRPHMRLYVNQQPVRDLAHPLASTDRVQIVQALSGG
jgi:sulfur carrier protein ThiS